MTMRTSCRSCRAPILWTLSEAGKRTPLDAYPHDEGTIEVYGQALGGEVGLSRVLTGDLLDTARENGTSLYRSHFASCPQAAAWRRTTARRG